jgi:hypothetical protein
MYEEYGEFTRERKRGGNSDITGLGNPTAITQKVTGKRNWAKALI